MTKQSCTLLVGFYDRLHGAEKSRIDGIDSNPSLRHAVIALHPTDARVMWSAWEAPMIASDVVEHAVIRMQAETIIKVILHQAFDETHGNDSLTMISKIQQEQIFASGIDNEVVAEVKRRLTAEHSALFLVNPEDCTQVSEYLQKEADFFLQKSFDWDEELMAALVGGNVAEQLDEVHIRAVSETMATLKNAPRPWFKKLLGE